MMHGEKQGWIINTFRELCNINQGLQIPIEDRYLTDGENRYFYITNQFLTEGSKEKYYIENPLPSVICNEDDILMTRTGNTGIVVTNVKGAFHNNFFKINYDKNKVIKDYLVQYLRSDYIQREIMIYASSTTIPDLKHSDFYRIKCVLPPLKEQEKIAEILSTWDLAIEKQEQLIEKKKEFKKGLMQMLLSGEVRFKEFNDKWKIKEIGNYIEEYKEKSTISNQYPVLTSSRNGIVLQKDYFKDNQVTTNDNIGYNIIPKGYITFRTRSDDGTFVFNQNKIIDMGIVSYFYPVFKFNEEINTYFAITWLNSCIDKQIRREIVGTSQLVLSLNKLKKFKINLPSIKEQNKIAEVLISVDEEIELLEKELEAIKLQKKGLMQRLLTGEVRVKV